ncbi:hypothetical protein CDIK_1424 [Cucumispora dikerogammari]|nr:hypothetical protein CDIK_1424 [Cucumispora dikerogammari]
MWTKKKMKMNAFRQSDVSIYGLKSVLSQKKRFCLVCRNMLVLGELKFGADLRWRCLAKKCAKKEICVRKRAYFRRCSFTFKENNFYTLHVVERYPNKKNKTRIISRKRWCQYCFKDFTFKFV